MGHSGDMVSTVSTEAQATALYRHFDADGRLLYVGISLNAIARLTQHRLTAHWFRSIARIEIEWHESRELAEAAEREAIKQERPAHNVVHAGMPLALRVMLEKIGKLHMVDENGIILPEYATLGPGEASELAKRLD